MAKDIAADVPPDFGRRLETAIAALRLSQTAAAGRLGITKEWINQLIRRRGKAPSVTLLAIMRKKLGTHAIDFCLGQREDPPPFRTHAPRKKTTRAAAEVRGDSARPGGPTPPGPREGPQACSRSKHPVSRSVR